MSDLTVEEYARLARWKAVYLLTMKLSDWATVREASRLLFTRWLYTIGQLNERGN